MIVYVITKGSYSDYHICAVTTDKQRAKKLKSIYTDSLDEAYIEEHDTEKTDEMVDNNYKCFACSDMPNGIEVKLENPDYHIGKMQITKDWKGHYYADVLAVDEEHAKKIFCDKLAEYKAQKDGI